MVACSLSIDQEPSHDQVGGAPESQELSRVEEGDLFIMIIQLYLAYTER